MLLQILTLLGSLAMFLYGMSLLKETSTVLLDNEYRDVLRTEHLSNIEKSSYPYETGSFYMDLINCLEKMGDFIINISQSVIEAKVV